MSVARRSEETVYRIGPWQIRFRYRRERGRRVLNCVAVSPLTPLEAEVLKVGMNVPVEWSYDDKTRTVELWVQPHYKVESMNVEKNVIVLLRRIVPEFARELSLRRLCEDLVEEGWVVSYCETRARARRSIRVGRRYMGYVEVELTGREGLFRGEATVVLLVSSWSEAQELSARLSAALKTLPSSEFPFLRFNCKYRRFRFIFYHHNITFRIGS